MSDPKQNTQADNQTGDPRKKEQGGADGTEKPVCTTATVAEHSRMDQEDEPCDDGRAG